MNSELDNFMAEIEGTAKRYANLRVLYDTLYGILRCLPDDAEMPYLGTFNVHEEIGWPDDNYDHKVGVVLNDGCLDIKIQHGVISLLMKKTKTENIDGNWISTKLGEWNTVADIVENWPRVREESKE